MIVSVDEGLKFLGVVRKALVEELGYHPMISGSKSGYRQDNPNKDPAFNAYVCWQDDDGLLWPVWGGDLELTECGSTLEGASVRIQKALGSRRSPDLYVFRESTVHNSTFNGGPFPYASWCARVWGGNYVRNSEE